MRRNDGGNEAREGNFVTLLRGVDRRRCRVPRAVSVRVCGGGGRVRLRSTFRFTVWGGGFFGGMDCNLEANLGKISVKSRWISGESRVNLGESQAALRRIPG